MPHVLIAAERLALEKLSLRPTEFLVKVQLPGEIALRSLAMLTQIGLIETGPSKTHQGKPGWRITADGWTCMFGRTQQEVTEARGRHVPFRVMQWPR